MPQLIAVVAKQPKSSFGQCAPDLSHVAQTRLETNGNAGQDGPAGNRA